MIIFLFFFFPFFPFLFPSIRSKYMTYYTRGNKTAVDSDWKEVRRQWVPKSISVSSISFSATIRHLATGANNSVRKFAARALRKGNTLTSAVAPRPKGNFSEFECISELRYIVLATQMIESLDILQARNRLSKEKRGKIIMEDGGRRRKLNVKLCKNGFLLFFCYFISVLFLFFLSFFISKKGVPLKSKTKQNDC